ncbi:hypothetical protein D3C84_836690 [compost metagenome]
MLLLFYFFLLNCDYEIGLDLHSAYFYRSALTHGCWIWGSVALIFLAIHDYIQSFLNNTRAYMDSSSLKRQHRLVWRVLVGRGQHRTESIAQQVPGTLLLFGIVVMQVMAPHPRAGQHMVLAAVDDVQADPQSLHHGRARAAQVMRRPVAVLAVGKDQGVVVTPS